MISAVLITGLFVTFGGAAIAPFWGIPVFPDTMTGDVVRDTVKAGDVDDLYSKFHRIQDFKDRKYVLYISPGTYQIRTSSVNSALIVDSGAVNVVIRGLTGNPLDVRFRGIGFDTRDEDSCKHLFGFRDCSKITLAHVTFEDAGFNGISVSPTWEQRNLCIYNVHFYNIGERAIKVSGGALDTERAFEGEVKYCYFACDTVHPAGYYMNGDYIAAIDCMGLGTWVFRNNVFESIRGTTGGGRAAIFIWNHSSNVIVENNIIVNCDRSIAFGNPQNATSFHVNDGIIRNNFVVAGVGRTMEICDANRVKIYNNTIYTSRISGQPYTDAIYLENSASVEIKNNIMTGNVSVNSGGFPDTSHNIHNTAVSWFSDVSTGNLHLTSQAEAVRDAGLVFPEATEDIDGCLRDEHPDIGADEFGADGCGYSSINHRVPHAYQSTIFDFAIHPNPFNAHAVIHFTGKTGKAAIRIYDLKGSLVMVFPETAAETAIVDCSRLPAGLFIITAVMGTRVSSKKMCLIK
ncbi:MAG: hypothetical protein A2268_00435 [Candidatus Raymondbacteria bacterium RifOxyA12_full_50_37]|uniref:Secretion system C-terminal sorting domain-containing protein n=1 Tax=Candidatus Raymondbacteria bacterium RIFOXYD12_FULL_49_13 TaxID=1817890 RepID=A0A1F7F2U5_UNCRA|nr:MAG: hypothetical protein A2268_00435 [Candidatus Raymondbacteria bacterium RifOxyA12_full_50_37]OGJ92783.1 MAG: hypothetical protein A2248_04485 [Candidatus Raymondbacteria bacterium RIFOXYA2_FULL_49_16]OGK00276.1 MAG: hypothetical protein A2350_16570 [Candidatus Raymondbacteria bacterium RifOxyB12_full_50_8]OGK00985.1 MAG: hypothetical protein A2519_17145 [Candidatus Raymondbacteria bacterium RIFOXYD12_FULL_49_13]OGK02451.1 MAG: hypothetical protein A2487_20740 [Candidatus Raymondbacteria 